MADEQASIDVNRNPTLIGETVEGEIRKVRVTDAGVFLTETGATISGIALDSLKVTDETTAQLLQSVIIQLKLISRKLDCLQPFDDQLDENDLDDIEQNE